MTCVCIYHIYHASDVVYLLLSYIIIASFIIYMYGIHSSCESTNKQLCTTQQLLLSSDIIGIIRNPPGPLISNNLPSVPCFLLFAFNSDALFSA